MGAEKGVGKFGEVRGPRAQFCPTCGSTVWTTVTSSLTALGFAWFFLCYCFCCVCSLLPFHLDLFKKYKHECPNCGALLKNIVPKSDTTIILVCFLIIFVFIILLFLLYVGL